MKLLGALALPALLGLSGCFGDETVSAYGAAGKTWQLVELEGSPFMGRATLSFPEPGRISGEAPCNRFTAAQEVPYPWFDAGPIAATRMACPELDQETAFLAALERATLVEVLGDTLILKDDSGVLMVFRARG